LDVHKRTVVACVRRVDPAGKVSKSIKTFATMTTSLLALSDWLAVQGVRVVSMESTGSYWNPVFNLLESPFEVTLVNPLLQQALHGSVTEHHRFLLQTQMNHLDHLERLIQEYSQRIEGVLDPFVETLARLVTIPGVDFRVAEVVVAEIGLDMNRFPTAGHLSSCPGLRIPHTSGLT
jgi:transposase